MLKAAEEFQELSLVLTQKVLKPNKVDDQQIIDEIGDVIIRLKVLKLMYDEKSIKKRIVFKITKFKEWLTNKTYDNI